MENFKDTLIQLTRNGMGGGDDVLALQLAQNYFTLLNEEQELPRVIAFYNAGVKLLCSSSPAIEALKKLEARGVRLIACKTCLNHFGLMDRLEAGVGVTMVDIMTFQKIAQKVINL